MVCSRRETASAAFSRTPSVRVPTALTTSSVLALTDRKASSVLALRASIRWRTSTLPPVRKNEITAITRATEAIQQSQPHHSFLSSCPIVIASGHRAEKRPYAPAGLPTRRVSVTCRSLEAIREISVCVRRYGDLRPLVEQATAIADRSRRMQMALRDRESIEARYDAALSALALAEDQAGIAQRLAGNAVGFNFGLVNAKVFRPSFASLTSVMDLSSSFRRIQKIRAQPAGDSLHRSKVVPAAPVPR